MCWMLAAAAAVTAAGSYAQSQGQNAASEAEAAAQMRNTAARTQTRTEELQRQKGFQDKSAAVFGNSLTANAAPAQATQLDTSIGNRLAAYQAETARAPATGDYLPTAADAPHIVKDQVGKSLSDALTRAGQSNQAKAQLEGFGDQQVQLGAGNQIAGANLGILANQSRGSASVVPAELDAGDQDLAARKIAAQRSGAGTRALGSLLTTAGSLGMTGAMLRGGTAGSTGYTGYLKPGAGAGAPAGATGGY